MVRRILRKIRIAEISGVDRPAQAHARAVIMKRAPEAHIGENYMSVDFGKLADVVLEGAAVALRKREPHLSPEQAYAKIYTSQEFRKAAEIEREASAARLAGVTRASLEPKTLDSLDDDAINALTVEIKNANPFLDDAGIIRLLLQHIQGGGVTAVKRPLRSTDDRGVSKDLTDGDLQRMADYERRINPSLSDEEIYRRVGASRAVREDRHEFHREIEAERQDDATSAIEAKADELRAANPELTKEMAFARAYSDPKNRELAKAERLANRPEG
jgi:hypothetical protein